MLFTHSLVARHLGHFYVLAILNNTVLNTCEQIFVWSMFLFLVGIHLAVEFLGHMVTLCLTFEGLPD